MHRAIIRRAVFAALTALVGLVGLTGNGRCVSDFDDGTLQGWTKLEPFNGELLNLPEGNPGGCLFCGDTMPGGGSLVAIAPPEFTGDIGDCWNLEWDEYVYACSAEWPTTPQLVSVVEGDTTIYAEAYPQVEVVGAWHHRALPLHDESYWVRVKGTATWAYVVTHLTQLRMSMECNPNCYEESAIDNVGFFPPDLPPDPAQCTVEPWDEIGHAWVTPGQQVPDRVLVTVKNRCGNAIGNAIVQVSFDCSLLCLNAGDCGLDEGLTNASGEIQWWPMVGGCEECDLSIIADGVVIRTIHEIVSTDWDGIQADGRVDSTDATFFGSVYGTQEPCADYDGDGTVDLDDFQTFGVSYNHDVNPAGCIAAAVSSPNGEASLDRAGLIILPNPVRSGDGLGIVLILRDAATVRLDAFDAAGVLVAKIADGERSAGSHFMEWSPRDAQGRSIPSGIYFLRLSGVRAPVTHKLIVLR